MWRSSFLVNLQASRLIASNFTIKCQMNSIIFQKHFREHFQPLMLPSCIDLSSPSHQILKSSPPCSQHLWETLVVREVCFVILVSVTAVMSNSLFVHLSRWSSSSKFFLKEHALVWNMARDLCLLGNFKVWILLMS